MTISIASNYSRGDFSIPYHHTLESPEIDDMLEWDFERLLQAISWPEMDPF